MTLEVIHKLVSPPYLDPGVVIPQKKDVSIEGERPSFFCSSNIPEQETPTKPSNSSDDFEPVLANYWKNVGEEGKTWYRVLLPHNCPDHLLDKVISAKFYAGQEGMKSTWCTHCKAPVNIDIESLQKEILSPKSFSQKQEKNGLKFVFPGKHEEIEEPLIQPEPWLNRMYKLI